MHQIHLKKHFLRNKIFGGIILGTVFIVLPVFSFSTGKIKVEKKQTMPTTSSVIPAFFGDSISVGFAPKGAPGYRRVGAGPREIYSYLEQEYKKNPTLFKGLVNLSTGISNNPGDLASVRKQFELLRQSGAQSVNVLGAAKGRYDPQNTEIESLAKEYGFNFLGGFKPGADRVHPETYSTYNGKDLQSLFYTPQGTQSAIESMATPVSNQQERVQTVLAKYKGVAGDLNKETNKFVEREWSPEESKRYEYYLKLNAGKNSAA